MQLLMSITNYVDPTIRECEKGDNPLYGKISGFAAENTMILRD